jgi:uncharacterized protein YPO0396
VGAIGASPSRWPFAPPVTREADQGGTAPFWLPDANATQPDRLFLVADRALSVANDFADFGTEVRALKKRLTASAVRVQTTFPPYSKDFRRRLGIESEQALELFHQTVSMKAVGSLDDFVRSHMLEPFDAISMTHHVECVAILEPASKGL